MFEINVSALSSNLYYHPELTKLVGEKHSEKYPSFIAMAITTEPHPSFVFIFSDFENGAMPFMFKEGIEAIRKQYKTGQWSPGAKAAQDKVIFGFFTHQNEDFIKAILKQLGMDEPTKVDKIISQFKDAKDLTKTPIAYKAMKTPATDLIMITEPDTAEQIHVPLAAIAVVDNLRYDTINKNPYAYYKEKGYVSVQVRGACLMQKLDETQILQIDAYLQSKNQSSVTPKPF